MSQGVPLRAIRLVLYKAPIVDKAALVVLREPRKQPINVPVAIVQLCILCRLQCSTGMYGVLNDGCEVRSHE